MRKVDNSIVIKLKRVREEDRVVSNLEHAKLSLLLSRLRLGNSLYLYNSSKKKIENYNTY
jgi:hypothetical protein